MIQFKRIKSFLFAVSTKHFLDSHFYLRMPILTGHVEQSTFEPFQVIKFFGSFKKRIQDSGDYVARFELAPFTMTQLQYFEQKIELMGLINIQLAFHVIHYHLDTLISYKTDFSPLLKELKVTKIQGHFQLILQIKKGVVFVRNDLKRLKYSKSYNKNEFFLQRFQTRQISE